MLCLTLLRESLGFCNLCRSHAACSIISIVYRELLAVTRQLCCCEVKPHIRLHIVLWHAPSVVIQRPKVVLRPCVALGCRFLVPSPRLHIVLWHAPSVVIQHPKVVLRPRVALGCLFLVPSPRIHIGLWRLSAGVIQHSKGESRTCV